MPNSAPRACSALLLVVGLLASLLLAFAPTGSAQAAAPAGKVRGAIVGAHGETPKVMLQWFTRDWAFLGKRRAYNGLYSLSLPPGTYWIQFVDQRPSYDVTKYAPTNVKVTVRAAHTSPRSVRMHPGAAITGTVKAGGRPASGATVIAANAAKQSFSVKANPKGQFAVGGLPAGSYSVFTYDRAKKWTSKSAWVAHLEPRQPRNVAVNMRTKAGSLLVDLYAGQSPVNKRVTVTVVSEASGQFWTTKSKGGSASFRGLYPGRYRMVMPGVGSYLGRTGAVSGGEVRANRPAFGSFRLKQHGGWVIGTVVDKYDETRTLPKATVRLYSTGGALLDETTSGGSGGFRLDGPLRTQSGMTVVVEAVEDGGYLGTEPDRCQYTRSDTSGVSLTTGKGTWIGDVGLQRAPGQQRSECALPDADRGLVSR